MMMFFLIGCTDNSNQMVDSFNDSQSNRQTEEASSNQKTKAEDKESEQTTSPSSNQQIDKERDKQEQKGNLNELKIHYIDAGQADATLFQYKDDEKSYTILYDTGDWKRNEVVHYLSAMGISFIDLIIISHPDADHIGQLTKIVNTYDVGEVWMSGNESTSQTFQEALEAILASDTTYEEPKAGNSATFGPMELLILHPKTITGKSNEESLSVLFTYGNNKFLFTGDAGKADEKEMLNRTPDLHADILQLGHHGSNTSSDESFIRTVNPDVAIYSAGADNSYDHPHAEVINLLKKLNITVYGTDVHGTILVTSNGKDYTIETKHDGTVSPKSDGRASGRSESKKADNKNSKRESNSETKDSADCININTASKNELQEIIHIGPKRADDVINNRSYDSVDDLQSINGIGPARIADIKAEGIACTGG